MEDLDPSLWARDAISREHPDLVDLVAPFVPEGPPLLGRWTGPTSRAGVPLRALFLGALVAAAALSLGLHSPLPLLIFLVALAQAAAVCLQYGSRLCRPADLRLLEDRDDPDVCLVEMEVFVERKSVGRTGEPPGSRTGGLLYSGRRTSFALGGEDVLPPKFWSTLSPSCGAFLPDLAVPLRLPKGQAYVRLIPIRKGGDIADRQEMRFLKRLYEFRLRPPRSQGPRQWPPLDLVDRAEAFGPRRPRSRGMPSCPRRV